MTPASTCCPCATDAGRRCSAAAPSAVTWPAANGDGHLLYVNKGTLFAVPFDLDRLETSGAPSPVLEGVGYSSTNGSAQFDASRNGTLIYRGGSAGDALVTLQWLDATGKTRLLPAKPAGYTQPRLSPNGSLIALTVAGAGGQDLWVYDWQQDIMKQLTFGAGDFKFPAWSPDGDYISGHRGIRTALACSGHAPMGLVTHPLTQSKTGQVPIAFTPDGNRLIFRVTQGRTSSWYLAFSTMAPG